ncbi:MAG: inner membrane CreD family protein, partial [Patescibacteria group bacterium]
IAALSVLLLIPTAFIAALIDDRANTQEEAIKEVSAKWGETQTIAGPLLSVPYKKYITNKEGSVEEVIVYAHFLPDELNINGEVFPSELTRDIYEVVVYNTELKIDGKFSRPDFSDWDIAAGNIVWADAFVTLGIPDMKGVSESIALKWNGADYQFNPGVKSGDVVASGVSIKVPVSGANNSFSLELNLNGSRELNFAPLGRET